MNAITYQRAVRCAAVVFAHNDAGREAGANLLSNMFNIGKEQAFVDLVAQQAEKQEWQKLGKSLKNFEDQHDSEVLCPIESSILDGLTIDGGHHKQHYLEETLTGIVGGRRVKYLYGRVQWEEGVPG